MNERKQYPYQEEEPKVIALADVRRAGMDWTELAFGASLLAFGLSLLALQ